MCSYVNLDLADPSAAVHERPGQKWLCFRVSQVLGPHHSSYGASAHSCALVLAVVHRPAPKPSQTISTHIIGLCWIIAFISLEVI